MPSAPSLQSWAALESKTASLDAESGAAALAAGLRAGPPLSQQAKDSDDSGNGAERQAALYGLRRQAARRMRRPSGKPRRGSSFNSDHVHGSSAALSALAQAYSRQGSPGPVGSAQDAPDGSPLECSPAGDLASAEGTWQPRLTAMTIWRSSRCPLEGPATGARARAGPGPGQQPARAGQQSREDPAVPRPPAQGRCCWTGPPQGILHLSTPSRRRLSRQGDFWRPQLWSPAAGRLPPWSPAAAAAGSEAKSPQVGGEPQHALRGGLLPAAARRGRAGGAPGGPGQRHGVFPPTHSKAAPGRDSASTTASARLHPNALRTS